VARKKQGVDFEGALEELEGLVERMEEGKLSLEESLKTYERGIELSRACQKSLDAAEQRIQILTEKDGTAETRSFQPDDDLAAGAAPAQRRLPVHLHEPRRFMNARSEGADDGIATFDVDLSRYRARANRALEACLPAADLAPAQLHEAMRYAVLNGGKRVRATLVYAAGEAVGGEAALFDAPACAVELIHAYSLVHDDLPVMDDDELRRGKPTCHRAFGEANALLAGDALQSAAFQVLSEGASEARRGMDMIATLAHASGSLGMAGGQAIDLAAVGRELGLDALEHMHRHKTGALIRASVRLGALCGESIGAEQLAKLDDYAACIGLAFQVRDDILDVEADTETLGKAQGADIALNKPTYPALLGLASAKHKAEELHERAIAELADFDARADGLRGISAYIVNRPH